VGKSLEKEKQILARKAAAAKHKAVKSNKTLDANQV
jgi:hypothetical protein